MAEPHEKLAASLEILKVLQDKGRRVFLSNEFSRTHRERLIKNGFLREIIKGWVMSSGPSQREGDTTSWYASFWEFCGAYCNERFGDEWHLSPEQSLLIHAGHTIIPAQLVVYSPHGTNNTLALPFGTSLYDLRQKEMPPSGDLELQDELRTFKGAAALLKVPEPFYLRYPIEAQIVLSNIKDASTLLRRLLAGGNSAVAGRLAGALRRVGRNDAADEIVATMKAADYVVREADPFEAKRQLAVLEPVRAPIIGRLKALWASHRQAVIDNFPQAPGLPKDKGAYLKSIDDVYRNDAYHSLSIEGYRVSPELIDRVKAGQWNPDTLHSDRDVRDALAARGYWQAFQAVKVDIEKVISGGDAGDLARSAHRNWYRELFQPCVAAKLIKAEALAGYRDHPVYIQGSMHVPPRAEAVTDAMPILFALMSDEPEPSVRAVLGHWLFGYVHPYPDGNGRIARFLMNLMLAGGGYPWTVIPVGRRNEYMAALEQASVHENIEPFSRFIGTLVASGLAGEPMPGIPGKKQ